MLVWFKNINDGTAKRLLHLDHVALRPQKRDGLLGTGTGGWGGTKE